MLDPARIACQAHEMRCGLRADAMPPTTGCDARPSMLGLKCAPVAQLDRAAASEAVGQKFESSRAHHLLLWPHHPLFPDAGRTCTSADGGLLDHTAMAVGDELRKVRDVFCISGVAFGQQRGSDGNQRIGGVQLGGLQQAVCLA